MPFGEHRRNAISPLVSHWAFSSASLMDGHDETGNREVGRFSRGRFGDGSSSHSGWSCSVKKGDCLKPFMSVGCLAKRARQRARKRFILTYSHAFALDDDDDDDDDDRLCANRR